VNQRKYFLVVRVQDHAQQLACGLAQGRLLGRKLLASYFRGILVPDLRGGTQGKQSGFGRLNPARGQELGLSTQNLQDSTLIHALRGLVHVSVGHLSFEGLTCHKRLPLLNHPPDERQQLLVVTANLAAIFLCSNPLELLPKQLAVADATKPLGVRLHELSQLRGALHVFVDLLHLLHLRGHTHIDRRITE
jgi:hypothetical protein